MSSQIIKEKNYQSLFNDEPVVYCIRCLSLAIRNLTDHSVYCDKCGCTTTDEIDIRDWEEKYEKKYGFKYIK